VNARPPAGEQAGGAEAPDVRCYSVGPIQENAYFVRAGGLGSEPSSALLVDPGDEPQRLLEAAQTLGVQVEAILITHCHFDHVGAVAPLARATGAPVYCPQIETPVLADVMKWTMPGFGPFESWQAEETVKGGEQLRLAGMDVQVIFTPGHSPGHVTYAISAGGGPAVLLSGDVLFQGSVGRVDLPGGDWATLERSIGELARSFPRETAVHPGHMGATTLGRELETNPFLAELRRTIGDPDDPQSVAVA
jgi:glyoxylase-like metal-dependent hydrolase (beta-lactamase superfamily II)